jgi:uncharacterized protein (TIGR02217 family)
MAFLEQRLDPRITVGAVFTETIPGRSLIRFPSGRLEQNFLSAAPLLTCELQHGIKTAADYQRVLDAWMVVMLTPYEGLRVKCWRDYQATQLNTTLTLISGSDYQLQRKHTFGAVSVLRNITKPVTGTVVVYRLRTGVTTVATATIDYTTGIATITGHTVGDTYTWAGEFDFPMTFSTNEWQASLEANTAGVVVVAGTIAMEQLP